MCFEQVEQADIATGGRAAALGGGSGRAGGGLSGAGGAGAAGAIECSGSTGSRTTVAPAGGQNAYSVDDRVDCAATVVLSGCTDSDCGTAALVGGMDCTGGGIGRTGAEDTLCTVGFECSTCVGG